MHSVRNIFEDLGYAFVGSCPPITERLTKLVCRVFIHNNMPKKENFCLGYYSKTQSFVSELRSNRVNVNTLLTTIICFVDAQLLSKF